MSGRAVSKVFKWTASVSSDVASYRVYVSEGDVPLDYDADFVNVGNVTEVDLGELANDGFMMLENAEGLYNLGVSAVDNIGNESAIAVKAGVFLDFVPPVAPTGLEIL